MENENYNSGELTHWGIRGMKWGVRRYQNKDGSLTPAGQKRRAKLEGKLRQLDSKGRLVRKKTVSEMTDDELKAKANRMRIEKDYYEAQRSLAMSNPVKESKGKKFMAGLMNDVIAPAAKNTGKAWLEKFMKDKLGLNEKDPVDRIKREAEKYRAAKEIEEYKKAIKDLREGKKSEYPEVKTWEDMIKKQKWDENERKRRMGEELEDEKDDD